MHRYRVVAVFSLALSCAAEPEVPLRLALDAACDASQGIELKIFDGPTCDELTVSLTDRLLATERLALGVAKRVRFGAGTRALHAATFDAQGAVTCRACQVAEFRGGANDPVSLSLTPVPPGDDCVSAIDLGVDQNILRSLETLSADYQDDSSAACLPSAGRDRVYKIGLAEPRRVRIKVNATFPHSVMIRGGVCEDSLGADPLASVLCRRSAPFVDAGVAREFTTIDVATLPAGDHYIWIEGRTLDDIGTYSIVVDLLDARDSDLVPNDACRNTDDPTGQITTGPIAVSTANPEKSDISIATDDFNLICQPADSDGPDLTFRLDVPMVTTPEAQLEQRALVAVAAYGFERPASPTWFPFIELRPTACNSAVDARCVASGGPVRFFNFPLPLADASMSAVKPYYLIVDSGLATTLSETSVSLTVDAQARAHGDYLRFESFEVYEPVSAPGASGSDVLDVTLTWDFPVWSPSGISLYRALHISPGGLVVFGTGAISATRMPKCFDDAPVSGFIAPFWSVTSSPAATALRTRDQLVSGHHVYSIEWANVDFTTCGQDGMTACGLSLSHQLKLHENGVIEMHYGPRTGPDSMGRLRGDLSTIGFQRGPNVGDYHRFRCTMDSSDPSNTVRENQVIYFVPPTN